MNTFKKGDRVLINSPCYSNHGEQATVVGYLPERGYYELRLDTPTGHGPDNRRWYREAQYLELVQSADPVVHLVSTIFCQEVSQ